MHMSVSLSHHLQCPTQTIGFIEITSEFYIVLLVFKVINIFIRRSECSDQSEQVGTHTGHV